MKIADQTSSEPLVESLQQKLEDYERWFRTLDQQVRALDRERQKFSAVVNHTDAGFLVVDTSLKVVWASEVFAQRFTAGKHPAQLVGATCYQLLCGNEEVCASCPSWRLLQNGSVSHQEMSLEIKGKLRNIYATCMPIKSPEGKITETILMLQDITDLEILRRSQEALQISETQLRTVLDTVGEGIIAIDSKSTILMANQKIESIFGYRRDELLGQSLLVLLPDKYHRPHLEGMKRHLETGGALALGPRLELEGQRKGGALFPLEVRITESKLADRLIFIAAVRDIAERKQAEAALRESEERFRTLFENVPVGVYRTTPQGKILLANPALLHILGYKSFEDMTSRNLEQEGFEPGYSRLEFRRRLELEGEIKGLEANWKRQDNSIVCIQENAKVVRDRQGKVLYYEGTVEDITERKRALEALRKSEEQLLQSQKMEAVGRLAGGVAHDFNNLLTVILGKCEFLQSKCTGQEELNRDIELILKTAERAAALTRQLLAFSRRQVLLPKVLDLNEIVADIENMLRRLIGEDIDLVTVLSPDLGKVKADPSQIEQVVMNLVVNARDALPGGGQLSIHTANVDLADLSPEEIHGLGEVQPGPYILLSVRDTGVGMDKDTLSHIFEPFFTTKEKGKGTGLGLATVYGIVKQSGGHIEVQSQPDRGTTFRVYLPRVEEELQKGDREVSQKKVLAGTEAILLVEDEAGVRELVRDILEENGYVVLEARHGKEALLICEEHSGKIDLLLTDVVMPHLSGPQLAEKITHLRPDMKVMYMSGYTDESIVQEGVLHQGMAFLQKPFTNEALSRKVREVLDSQTAKKTEKSPMQK